MVIVMVTGQIHYGLGLSDIVHKMSGRISDLTIVSADHSLFMRLQGEA